MPEAPCPFVQILPSDFAPVALVLNPEKNKQGTKRACYKSKTTQAKIRARKYWRNVNLQDADGESPLHKAARFGDAKTARLFFCGYRKDGESCVFFLWCGACFFLFVWVVFLPQKRMDIESDQC